MARFDDVVCYDFVEHADGFGKWVVVVAKGEEKGFYCFWRGSQSMFRELVSSLRDEARLTVLGWELLAFLSQSHAWLGHVGYTLFSSSSSLARRQQQRIPYPDLGGTRTRLSRSRSCSRVRLVISLYAGANLLCMASMDCEFFFYSAQSTSLGREVREAGYIELIELCRRGRTNGACLPGWLQ